ncbi:MAG: hypothetical protein ACMG6E_04640, partial [Candidatus Roizmanbacteria bacterium]
MAETKNQLNIKVVAETMATTMLRHLFVDATSKLAPFVLQWARDHGADIKEEDESVALDELRKALPVPAHWPTLEIKGLG